jgi:drug/metabolite transporter (DMT)-like permease
MLGLVLLILAAILFGVSISIQKYSLSSLKKFTIQSMLKSKPWILALIIGLSGTLTYLASLSLIPLSTAQPVVSVYLLIPILVGYFKFKEKLEVKQWLLIGFFLIGIILVSFY